MSDEAMEQRALLCEEECSRLSALFPQAGVFYIKRIPNRERSEYQASVSINHDYYRGTGSSPCEAGDALVELFAGIHKATQPAGVSAEEAERLRADAADETLPMYEVHVRVRCRHTRDASTASSVAGDVIEIIPYEDDPEPE